MARWVSFVRGNPVNRVDPSGHADQDPGGGCGLDECIVDDSDPLITYDDEYGYCILNNCTGNKEEVHQQLTEGSIFWQDVALGSSSVGMVAELVGLAITAPVGGIEGAVIGNGIHQTITNPIETVASGLSTGMTFFDDLAITHKTRVEGGKLILDESTATSVVLTTVGTAIPIATVDAFIDAYAAGYNHQRTPVEGLFSLFNVKGKTLFDVIQFGE